MPRETGKARIEVLQHSKFPKLPRYIDVQFNPTEYSLSKGAQIAEIGIPGIDSPILQFVRGQNEKLTMELFFDTTADGMGKDATDVRDETDPIYQLVKVHSNTHAPPRVQVTWGSGLSLTAVVENVDQKFTLFNPDGIPLRATVNVTFREYKDLNTQLKELNLQSPDHTKLHIVKRGETLSSIAASEYDNPALWRMIADAPANAGKFRSPWRLTPGTALELPPFESTGVPA